ncbi:sensor histidine kinase [Aureibacter tunicatorum]|uniref:histidine kinase n=1 Tax=Aureibacter tunicatorum TaxID=866807 RepID=A0AAE4BQU2_9BACT|nr:ATP-binding protein [Aureibacter tunicatorum]MDR6237268.1 signal transduction histidine kinase [Aureibacter tunicatorum]BDD06260.1 hypothetical protein AUTU_37430 [Aureibacter tunicatorum]
MESDRVRSWAERLSNNRVNGREDFRKSVLIKLGLFALCVAMMVYTFFGDYEYYVVMGMLGLVVVLGYKLVVFFDEIISDVKLFADKLVDSKNNRQFSSNEQGSLQNYLVNIYQQQLRQNQQKQKVKQSQFSHLKTIIQHIEIGLISFEESGKIHIFNSAARQLLKCGQHKNINELKPISLSLVDQFKSLKTGGRTLVKIEQEDDTIQLSIFAIELNYMDRPVKLIALQNLQTELEQNEMEAWKKLVRVLTHEIMNSVTPITSLSQTIEDEIIELQSNESKEEDFAESMDDIRMAVKTIGKRGRGLISFVNDFKNITHIPKPDISKENLFELLVNIKTLHLAELQKANVSLNITDLSQSPIVEIDKSQIEQVFINLIKNAIQAMKMDEANKYVNVVVKDATDKDMLQVNVSDNGKGIDEDALGRIFVPFFTTKKEGSGIGLSLSKQIIRQHLGTISVKSKLGAGTEFTLKFKKEIADAIN